MKPQCMSGQAIKMRLICFWCALLATVVRAQDNGFYAPQTYRQSVQPRLFKPEGPWGQLGQANRISPSPFQQRGLFTPNDVTPQGSIASWRPAPPILPAPVREQWPAGPVESPPAPLIPKVEPWRSPNHITKEQRANILHHKQTLTSEGAFRFEYASDNGLAAGEQIEPDGSRVGAYQYKDPSGQLVTLKYKAGKDGFQILEGSHIPKSPEPVPPQNNDNHYINAYEQQRRAYELQQQYNQQPRPESASWKQSIPEGPNQAASGGQYFTQNWRPQDGQEDDGQYRENEVDNKGPHSFGEGYAFSFKG